MKFTACSAVVGIGLVASRLCGAGIAAEPTPLQLFPSNYQVEIELVPKEGAPWLFKAVTTGERIRAGFVVPPVSEESPLPATLKFEAEFEVLSPEKVWLRNFVLGYHVGVVRRDPRPDLPMPLAEPPGPGERPRVMERRLRDAGQAIEPWPGELEAARRGAPGRREAAPGPGREMQSMESMINSSAVLTLGQPLVVREDPTGRVSLTIRRLEK